MVFTQAGWQRIGSLGKTEKSIDLDLIDERADKGVKRLRTFMPANYKEKRKVKAET